MLRTGGIEFVDGWALSPERGTPFNIPSCGYEKVLVEAFSNLLKTLVFMCSEPPAVCNLGFVGVNGYSLSGSPAKLDRDVMMLPPIMVEDFSASAPATLKPLFDMVWNTFGRERSLNYDRVGVWSPQC
jgi:hypothetical protein